MKKYYPLTRALHLYIGLFISPLVLLFAVSVLVFDHLSLINKLSPNHELQPLKIQLDSIPLRNSDILTARAILDKIRMKGEIDYLNKNDSSMFFPVKTPGTLSTVSVNTRTKVVSVRQAKQGILKATTYMHSMPGPHNASIRGNSMFIRIWRYCVDTIVYSLLFLTFSGIFLWFFLSSERKLGVTALVIGAVIFTTLLFLTF